MQISFYKCWEISAGTHGLTLSVYSRPSCCRSLSRMGISTLDGDGSGLVQIQDPAVLEYSFGEQSQCSSPPRMCGKARTAMLQCWSDAQSRSLQQHMGMAKLLCLTHQPIPVLLPLSCQCIHVNKIINAETKPSTNTPQRFQLCPFKTLISSLARFKHLKI